MYEEFCFLQIKINANQISTIRLKNEENNVALTDINIFVYEISRSQVCLSYKLNNPVKEEIDIYPQNESILQPNKIFWLQNDQPFYINSYECVLKTANSKKFSSILNLFDPPKESESDNFLYIDVESNTSSNNKFEKKEISINIKFEEKLEDDDSSSKNSRLKVKKKIKKMEKNLNYETRLQSRLNDNKFLIEERFKKKELLIYVSEGLKFTYKEMKCLRYHRIKIIEDVKKPFHLYILNNCRRTISLLSAINRNISIISHKWLEAIFKSNTMERIDYKNYYFCQLDLDPVKDFKFLKLFEIIQVNPPKGFLKGYKVWIPSDIKPSFFEVRCLIESAKGQIRYKIYESNDDEFSFNVINKENKSDYENGVFYDLNCIYEACMIQELDLEKFKL